MTKHSQWTLPSAEAPGHGSYNEYQINTASFFVTSSSRNVDFFKTENRIISLLNYTAIYTQILDSYFVITFLRSFQLINFCFYAVNFCVKTAGGRCPWYVRTFSIYVSWPRACWRYGRQLPIATYILTDAITLRAAVALCNIIYSHTMYVHVILNTMYDFN